jgi:predicted MFS family arabinose efflux permease/HEAT repeat protein
MNKPQLTPGEKVGARKTLTRYNFLNVISFVLLSGNIITLFALRLGAGSILIGVLSSISYASYVAIFLGRHLAPKLGVVRLMGRYWLIRYFAMIPILAAPLFATNNMLFISFALILVSVAGFNICRGIAISGYNPIIGEITSAEERGSFLARLQAISHTVTLLLGIAMALVLGRNAPIYMYDLFITIGIFSGISATAVFFRLPELMKTTESISEGMLSSFRSALHRPAFRKFTVVHFLVSFSTFMVTPFLILYLKDVYQQPDNFVIFYTVFGSLGGVIMALVSGFLIDRIGAKPLYFLFTGVITLSLTPLILSPALDSTEAVIFSIFIFFFHSFGSLGVVTTGQTYFFNAIIPEERLNLGALYYLIEGLGGGLGALSGGIILDWCRSVSTSPKNGYALYFILPTILFIALVFIASRMERLGAYSIADTLSIIFSPRDLRAISLLHRLRRSTSLSEQKRVIEALAGAPSEISIGEVLTRLKSPRFTIRVEALAALRKLPADDREVQPLIRELKNQTYTTAHLAAELIGRKGYTEAIPILQKQLASDNYFLSGECMVALARLENRESISRIRNILTHTANPRLIIHAAAALEIFKDALSIPVLINKLKRKTSPYLRDEIILSVAGIIGMGAWFYPICTRFLEKATEGISLLKDYAQKCDTVGHTTKEVQNILSLMSRRDRTAFAQRAGTLLENLDLYIGEVNVSDCFSIALKDERLLRLDRFCFLAVSLIVWSLNGKQQLRTDDR